MRPALHPGQFVFTSVPRPVPPGLRPVVTVAEDEGLTLVVAPQQADAAGLAYDYVAAWITLQVTSALDAVGLTAAVASALARAGLSCNVVAGFHHDHLFVPYHRPLMRSAHWKHWPAGRADWARPSGRPGRDPAPFRRCQMKRSGHDQRGHPQHWVGGAR